MSTLAKFGLWQKAQEPVETGSNRVSEDLNRPNPLSNRVNQQNRLSEPSRSRERHLETHACAKETDLRTDQQNNPVYPVCPVSEGVRVVSGEAYPVLPGLRPDGDAALGPDDPGDEGLAWHGEYEAPLPPASEPVPHRPSHAPAPGSLVQRLVAAGATVRTWSDGRGGKASIEAPAGIPLELVKEVEARGWAIIPGGKPNPEAEHDSWLAGLPIAELER